MTERVKLQLEILRARKYRNEKVTGSFDAKYYKDIPPEKRKASFFCDMISKQKPFFIGDDPFGFNQYFIPIDYKLPFPHSGNITIDYEGFLEGGISGLRARIAAKYGNADKIALEFYDALYEMLDKVEILAEEYRRAATERGNTALSLALTRVPAMGATNYYEALLSVKILQYILRINFNSHITLGRFDKYMQPYFEHSLAMGASEAELFELTELFFISLNFDSDTYLGMQQGDNGQSLVIGGCDAEGVDFWCSLSEICLTASEELMLIDPKIHVRVNQRTPLEFYERCTRLTKQGLGFPQYSNDDDVIPGLVKMAMSLSMREITRSPLAGSL